MDKLTEKGERVTKADIMVVSMAATHVRRLW
jgi:hypothetical protein